MSIASFTGVSNYLAPWSPDSAAAVNPFNSAAQTNDLVAKLSRSNAESEVEKIRSQAQRLIRIAPTLARGYSLAAETYMLSGEVETARHLYDVALSLNKAEVTALQRSYVFLLREGKIASALDRFDLIGRRWPDRIELFMPMIPALLNDPAGYQHMLGLLQSRPPWRGSVFAALGRQADGLELAYRLSRDINRLEEESNPAEAGRVMWALISAKRYDLAYRLFLFTQTDSDRKNSGYVFNSAFETAPSGRPFDWAIGNSSGASISWIEGSEKEESRIHIRFVNKPAKHVRVSQYTHIPPGDYILSVTYSSKGLKLPKGLNVELSCSSPSRNIVQIQIPESDSEHSVVNSEFSINDSTCSIYIVRLSTDLIAESFRYKYNGYIDLESISIKKSS